MMTFDPQDNYVIWVTHSLSSCLTLFWVTTKCLLVSLPFLLASGFSVFVSVCCVSSHTGSPLAFVSFVWSGYYCSCCSLFHGFGSSSFDFSSSFVFLDLLSFISCTYLFLSVPSCSLLPLFFSSRWLCWYGLRDWASVLSLVLAIAVIRSPSSCSESNFSTTGSKTTQDSTIASATIPRERRKANKMKKRASRHKEERERKGKEQTIRKERGGSAIDALVCSDSSFRGVCMAGCIHFRRNKSLSNLRREWGKRAALWQSTKKREKGKERSRP